MVNVNKLRGKIIEKGLNISKLAKIMGITKSTLYRKFNSNGANISIKDATLIIKALSLNIEETNAIFFQQFCRV